MKTIACIASATILFVQLAAAQLPASAEKTKAAASSKLNPGKLLTQFSNAIKPASFISSWAGEKSSWLRNARKITDAVGMAQSVASLTGFIKPEMFKSGFDVNDLMQTVNTAKTMTDAVGMLKDLEDGLKPEAFDNSWNRKRSTWINALDALQ